MVEHNLAKVGVAGPSPVSRSKIKVQSFKFRANYVNFELLTLNQLIALVVELVDTQDLKSCNHCGCAGSSPARGTKSSAFAGLLVFLGANKNIYSPKFPFFLLRFCFRCLSIAIDLLLFVEQ